MNEAGAETTEERVISYDDIKNEKDMQGVVVIPELEEHPVIEGVSLEELYKLSEGQEVVGVFNIADILRGVPESSQVKSRALAFVRASLGKKLKGKVDCKNLRRPASQAEDVNDMVDPERWVVLLTPKQDKE